MSDNKGTAIKGKPTPSVPFTKPPSTKATLQASNIQTVSAVSASNLR
jgi:hypothetical protein